MTSEPGNSHRRYGDLPDEELIAAANALDSDAFEALYYRYRDWVLQSSHRITQDREMALDVMQDCFAYFARKFPGFQLTAKLKTFLYPVVKNLSIRARDKSKRYIHDPAALENQVDAATPSNSDEHVTAAIASLPLVHKEVLYLRFVDELDLQEIAIALDIPLGTVKSRLHNALKTLSQSRQAKDLLRD